VSVQQRQAAARALAQEAALAEVFPVLVERGVRPLLIKGHATARLLGTDSAARPSGDLDLLVAESALPATKAVLLALGFQEDQDWIRRTGPSEVASALIHAHAWTRGGPFPVAIDLHHSLYRVQQPSVLFAALSRDAHTITIGPTVVEVPGDGACALIVALHAAHHHRDMAKPLEDLRRATLCVPELTWHQAASLASELGVVGSFAFGLRLVDSGALLANRLGVSHTGKLGRRLRTPDTLGGARWIDSLLHAPTLRVATTVLYDAVFPSPRLVRAFNPELGSSRWRLAAYYLRRWLRIPRALALYAYARVRHVDE